MARIVIEDLPLDKTLSQAEIKDIIGGSPLSAARLAASKFVYPRLHVGPRVGPARALMGYTPYDQKHPVSCCFSPGTLVITPAGPVTIESVEVGDTVLTYDPLCRGVRETEVEHVDVHVGRHELMEVRIGRSEVVLATANHKFSDGRAWVRCDELTEVALMSGRHVEVTASPVTQKARAVYNLRTADGTYLVGRVGALVSGGTIEARAAVEPTAATAAP